MTSTGKRYHLGNRRDRACTRASLQAFVATVLAAGLTGCSGRVAQVQSASNDTQIGQNAMLNMPRGKSVVDADLSDWEGDHVRWYRLDSLYYGEPDARDVTDARFTARWYQPEGKIYVAVIVTDTDDFRTDGYGPLREGWDDGDRIELLSVGDAEAATGWSTNHDVAQEYVVGVTPEGGSWGAWGTGDPLHPDTELTYAARSEGSKLIYEAAVKCFDNYGRFTGEPTVVSDLKPGNVVRFDVIVNTRHQDGFGMRALDDNGGRWNDSGKITRFILVPE